MDSSIDLITLNGLSHNLILFKNSFLYKKLRSLISQESANIELHQITPLPHFVIEIALSEFSMKIVSTKRKLMEIARAGECLNSFLFVESC